MSYGLKSADSRHKAHTYSEIIEDRLVSPMNIDEYISYYRKET